VTRAQTVGVLLIGIVAGLAALVAFVSGVVAIFDNGLFGALPALVIAPGALGLLAYRAIAWAGPDLANPRKSGSDAQSLRAFVERAQSTRPGPKGRR